MGSLATATNIVVSAAHAQMSDHHRRHRHRTDDIPAGFPIWPGLPPGGGGPELPETISRNGALTNISSPTVTVVRPFRPNGSAMLIAAGGGYKQIENGKEAYPAAQWLASIGITSFVLTYRLPREGWRVGTLAPFQDAERAIRTIRGQSAFFGIDPHKIGVLGFSAGGHLLGMESGCADQLHYTPIDALDHQSGRPDLTMLIYPIVTLEPPFQNTSTRRILLGDHPDGTQSAQWSVQSHIHPGLNPFFLVQAADDPVSNPENTLILQNACQKKGVEVLRYLFPTGGHGFGLGKPGTETIEWPNLAERWLSRHGFV